MTTRPLPNYWLFADVLRLSDHLRALAEAENACRALGTKTPEPKQSMAVMESLLRARMALRAIKDGLDAEFPRDFDEGA